MNSLTQKDIENRYARAARWYDFWNVVFEFFGLRRLRREFLKTARGRVLEVGIGTGRNLDFYPMHCSLLGIELTPEMLKLARKRAARLERSVTLIQGDAQQLPFKKESFDTVVDTFCLCTYPNPVKALREIKRVCKRGGQILLLEHGKSSNSFVERVQRWREEPHYRSIGCRLLLNHEELARKAGLRVVKSERKLFGIFYVMRAGV